MAGQALVRMPLALAARVHDLALADGLTDSAWLRGLAATAAALPHEARPTTSGEQPLDVAAIGLLGRQVSRLNGAVTQLVKNLRLVGDPTAVREPLESVLSELRGCRDDLVKVTGAIHPRRRRRG